MKRIISFTAAAFIGGIFALTATNYFLSNSELISSGERDNKEASTFNYVSHPSISGTTVNDFTMAASKTVNGVVHVKTEIEVQNAYNPWADFFGDSSGIEPYVQKGSGSGVIISDDGYIITNNHVIEGADNIEVSMNDNRSYSAELIGTDPTTDIAVLKIEGSLFPSLKIGDSEAVKIGEWVLAVGNPFDLTSTVTAGIVSAKGRNINLLSSDPGRKIFPIESFIQTDAAVNPGNSGGALVNTNGELIGINTAIASRTGSFSGYSFAVPSSIASKVAEDLIKYGQVQRAYIGVRIKPVTETLANDYNLPNVKGIHVNSLTENGAAYDAGIKSGDVILQINSKEVNSVPQLQEQISKYRPGDNVTVTVWRGGIEKDILVELRDNDGGTALKSYEKSEIKELLGAQFSDISDETKTKLGITGGAQVKELQRGKLSYSGIKKGFIVTKIDGDNINSSADLENFLENKSGGILLEGVYENGTKAYYGFGL
ncbi:MAG TPA: Do family serine endopeptidase [Flavobacteriales bacterium]|nr:Do family serine endopeptidase [Flavobacteriales bacterium]|tara:strand:+ start:2204 stop:3661 length:1458 start_codon:yes stop_codon:yes gene_type:complete